MKLELPSPAFAQASQKNRKDLSNFLFAILHFFFLKQDPPAE